MMTVIVPTDFSQVANNAAQYAAQMLTGQYEARIVLYHVYERENEAEEVEKYLGKLKDQLAQSGIVKIETRCEESTDFIGSLDRLARHLDAQLVVMGITGKSRIEQVFLGSNTLKMVEKNACPVLIIPPSAQYTEVKNVAMATDLKDVETAVPVVPIKNVLDIFRPSLHIVNVNSDHYVSLTEEFLGQRAQLQDMFREYRPEFYFIGTYDLHETVQQFIIDKDIDLLVTVPRRHTLLSSFFKTSNTRRLVYESSIPILAAHE
ncbi:MAG TPA: universal stress protein [Chitinophagaceae bacterium]|jgi:nucleotide-binding universal stress UspA family protein|nr:universal stress protein [Chitinophagaceae bacterium]